MNISHDAMDKLKAKPVTKGEPEVHPFEPRHNFDGSGGEGPKYLRTEELLGMGNAKFSDRLFVRLAESILGIGAVNKVCLRVGTPWPSSNEMINHLFRELGIKWKITNPEMFREIEGDQVVFVANHPYGMPDAFAVNNMLEEYRPDFRLFANSFLTIADSITHRLLFVDPFMAEKNRKMNRRSMMQAMKHLRKGGDLALFPGRICSHLKWGQKVVQDGEWTDQVKLFVEGARAKLVPLHISGRNSWRFQAAGLVHPKLRTLLILREFLRGNHDFTFTLGEPVPFDSIARLGRHLPVGQVARALTYGHNPALSAALPSESPNVRTQPDSATFMPEGKSTDFSEDHSEVARELGKYPLVVEHKNLEVRKIDRDIPAILLEAISRLRFDAYSAEAAVSSPGELIDKYDDEYSHLVLWDKKARTLAGVYRFIVPGDRGPDFDPGSLVTASIFDLDEKFGAILSKSLEIGRAAIRPEYQKNYYSLMLLWRAILEILNQDKSVKYLIGPVTISRAFSPISRTLLKTYLETSCTNPAMAGLAKPRQVLSDEVPPEVSVAELANSATSLGDIGNMIEVLEAGQRRLPVLFRHYTNLGCRYIATGEWPELDGAMASLAVLDLKDAKRAFIARYLGAEKADAFFEGR